MSEDDTAFVIRMPKALHSALKEQAAKDERSMAQAIRYAIRQYLGLKP